MKLILISLHSVVQEDRSIFGNEFYQYHINVCLGYIYKSHCMTRPNLYFNRKVGFGFQHQKFLQPRMPWGVIVGTCCTNE